MVFVQAPGCIWCESRPRLEWGFGNWRSSETNRIDSAKAEEDRMRNRISWVAGAIMLLAAAASGQQDTFFPMGAIGSVIQWDNQSILVCAETSGYAVRLDSSGFLG